MTLDDNSRHQRETRHFKSTPVCRSLVEPMVAEHRVMAVKMRLSLQAQPLVIIICLDRTQYDRST